MQEEVLEEHGVDIDAVKDSFNLTPGAPCDNEIAPVVELVVLPQFVVVAMHDLPDVFLVDLVVLDQLVQGVELTLHHDVM